MMKAKSLDFIVGYVFAKMDRSIFEQFGHNDTKETLVESITVPKIWFGLSSCQQVTNDIKGDEKYILRENICEALNSIYPRLETICKRIIPEKYYIRFDFKVKYREQVKKMTLEIFKFASDVTAFVNQHNIQQGDIQALFYSEHSNTYYLYYWS